MRKLVEGVLEFQTVDWKDYLIAVQGVARPPFVHFSPCILTLTTNRFILFLKLSEALMLINSAGSIGHHCLTVC